MLELNIRRWEKERFLFEIILWRKKKVYNFYYVYVSTEFIKFIGNIFLKRNHDDSYV